MWAGPPFVFFLGPPAWGLNDFPLLCPGPVPMSLSLCVILSASPSPCPSFPIFPVCVSLSPTTPHPCSVPPLPGCRCSRLAPLHF